MLLLHCLSLLALLICLLHLLVQRRLERGHLSTALRVPSLRELDTCARLVVSSQPVPAVALATLLDLLLETSCVS